MTNTAIDSSAVEETEFEAAFAEFSSAREPAAADNLDEESGQQDDQAPHNQGDLAAQSNNQSQEPDDQSGEEDDLLAELPEEARKRFEALQEENKDLQHKFQSNVGRVSAYQRKLTALEDQINEIRQGSTSGDQPSQADIVDAMRGTTDDWNEFKENYPEIASVIDKRFEQVGQATKRSLESTLEPINRQIASTAEREEREASQASVGAVAEVFPTWTEEVKTTAFAQWLDQQSPGVASLADSADTQDAVSLISLYDAHRVAQGQSSIKVEKSDPIEPGVQQGQPNQSKNRRQQQLAAGANVRNRTPGVDANDAPIDEYEAAFNHFAKKKDQARAQQY